MWKIRKSETFKAQLLAFSRDYKERVSLDVARNFVYDVNNAITFVARNPFMCSLYTEARHHEEVKAFEFRKWSLKNFPHIVLFRVEGETIILQAIYADRMNIAARFPSDFGDK